MHALNQTLSELTPGEDLPCTETLRSRIYTSITSGGYNLTLEALKVDINFKRSTLASGYTVELFRRSYSLTKNQNLGRVSFTSSNLDKSLLDTMRPTQHQQYCSADCNPGSKSSWTNLRTLPCCWHCKPCEGHSYSNMTNADTCTQCNVDEKSNEYNTGCVKVDQEYIKYNSTYFMVGCAGCGVGLSLVVVAIGFIIRGEDRPVVKASDPTFLYIFLLSLMLGCIGGLLALIEPNPRNCWAEYLAATVFASLVTSSLALRCTKIYSLFAAAEGFSKPKFGFLYTHWGQIMTNFTLLIINLVVAVITLHFNAWQFDEAQKESHHAIYRICFTDSYLITCPPFIIPFLLFISVLVLAFRMRNFPHNFRETANIFMATFLVFLACIMFLTGYKLAPYDIKAVLRSIILFMTSIAFLLCMFIPKIIILMKKVDQKIEKERMTESIKAFSMSKTMRVHTADATTV